MGIGVVWEARSASGNDNNGGGFQYGAAGNDYSQQDTFAFQGTNLTVHSSDPTKVQPDGHTPDAMDVGNTVNIVSGAGFTLTRFWILAQDGTFWTLNAAPAATSTSGGTWYMGGACATANALLTNGIHAYSSHVLWLRGTFNEDLDLTSATGTALGDWCRVIGYGSSRFDRGQFTINGGDVRTHCAHWDGNNSIRTRDPVHLLVANGVFQNATTSLFRVATDAVSRDTDSVQFLNCQFLGTGVSGTKPYMADQNSANKRLDGVSYVDCLFDTLQNAYLTAYQSNHHYSNTVIRNMVSHGISIGSYHLVTVVNSLIHSNGGGGVYASSTNNSLIVMGCTIHGNSGAGVVDKTPNSAAQPGPRIIGNAITNNTGLGLDIATRTSGSPGTTGTRVVYGNFVGGNNGHAYSASTQANQVSFDNDGDYDQGVVVLTSDPYADAGAGDFTPASGSALRADNAYRDRVAGAVIPEFGSGGAFSQVPGSNLIGGMVT